MKRLNLGFGLSLTFMAISVLISPALAEVNLLVNPGFEDGGGSYDGWTTFGDGIQLSTSETDNIFRSGVAASKTFGEFNGCPGSPAFDTGGYFQAFTPTADKEYVLSGYSFIDSNDPIPGTSTCDGNRAIAKIVFYDAAVGGAEMSTNETVIGNWETPQDQWIPFSVSAPVPVGAMRVQAFILFLQPACDTGSVFIDDLSFSEVDPVDPGSNLLANPSFDTSLTGWNVFGNAFFEGRSFGLRTPTGSAKLFGPFVAPGDASLITQAFLATPGSSWEFQVYAMTTCVEDPITGDNDNLGIARVSFLNAAGAEIDANETVIVDSNSALGTWSKHSVLAMDAPAGTDSVRVEILFVQPTNPLLGGAIFVDDAWFGEPTTVDVPIHMTGRNFQLYQNVPNPFRPTTRIDFTLARADVVRISIYDVQGKRIDTLYAGALDAGPHSVSWDGTASNGSTVAAGVYRYVLKTSTGQASRSMMLLK